MKIRNKEIKNSTLAKPKKNVSAILVLGVTAILIAGGIFFALSKMFETETYYTLNQNVPAKASISKDMLQPIEAAKGTAPLNSVSMAEIQNGSMYAKYPLNQGDVIASSNVGPIVSNYDGVPDQWVITSFKAKELNSANGAINKGDYFDLIKDGRLLVANVLILDVSNTSGPIETEETQNNSDNYRAYTVGMPEEIAPYVLKAVADEGETGLHLVRSPIAARYEERTLADLVDEAGAPLAEENKRVYSNATKSFRQEDESEDGWEFKMNISKDVFDLLEGTDSSFSPIVRDKNSRPVNEDNCADAKIVPSKLCKINGFETPDEEESSSEGSSETSESDSE